MGIDSFPKQFDPRLSAEAISSKINKLIYAGLLTRDIKMDLAPDLAREYSIEDALTVKFILRDGIFFHDGTRLTSSDVKATYQTILDGELRTPGIAIRDIIKSIEAPDAQTIIFRLKKPYTPILSLMTIGILPEEIAQKKVDSKISASSSLEKYQDYSFVIGAGPFRLLRASLDDGLIELARHDKYHGEIAKPEKLVLRVIPDGTLRSMELMKGRLDIVQNAIPYSLLPVLKENHALDFSTLPGINFSYMAFNLKHPALNNKSVRLAIAHAVDRDRIIKFKLEGLAIKATSILSPSHFAHNPDLSHLTHDPALARDMLDKSGFPDPDGDGPLPRFKLVYKTSSDRERQEIARLLAENLAAIGIEVVIKSYEFGTFFRDIKQGDFDIFTLTWVGFSDADGYYDKFHSSQFPPNGNNRGFYSDNALDVLLEQSRIEQDLQIRTRLYHAIQKKVYDDMVYVPLWYETNFAFTRTGVKGYQLRPDAGFGFLTEVQKE